jgi:thiamine kinase-like enzyme
MVPAHNDPNNKNFLLAGDRIYIIDWDDIVLSDPLRDTGLLLWWYVPGRKWREFFTTYEQPLNESTLQRIYWWGARASLRVALWYDRKRDEQAVGAFVTDFLAVLNRRQNPHAPFNE